MPVLLLTHYLKYGLIEANYFLTGPTIVDKSNIDQVAKLVTAGLSLISAGASPTTLA